MQSDDVANCFTKKLISRILCLQYVQTGELQMKLWLVQSVALRGSGSNWATATGIQSWGHPKYETTKVTFY